MYIQSIYRYTKVHHFIIFGPNSSCHLLLSLFHRIHSLTTWFYLPEYLLAFVDLREDDLCFDVRIERVPPVSQDGVRVRLATSIR